MVAAAGCRRSTDVKTKQKNFVLCVTNTKIILNLTSVRVISLFVCVSEREKEVSMKS